jgi:hypothetical protein
MNAWRSRNKQLMPHLPLFVAAADYGFGWGSDSLSSVL